MPALAGAAGIFIGSAVIIGWAVDFTPVKSVSPGTVTMKANTALAFVLLGAALWLTHVRLGEPLERFKNVVAALCAFLPILLGALTLVEYSLGWNLGIDEMLFPEDFGATHTTSPGRMAPTTAINFILLGSAILLTYSGIRRKAWLTQSLAVVAGLVCFFCLVGYFYGVDAFLGIAKYTPMAVLTGALFVALAVGITLLDPESEPVSTLLSDDAGGRMARRLLPVAICVPIVLGWLQLAGERSGLYVSEFGTALLIIMVVATTCAYVWHLANSLNRGDALRLRGDDALALRAHELNRAKRELQNQAALLQSIISSIGDGIIVADNGGRITHFNPAAERMLGTRPTGDSPEAWAGDYGLFLPDRVTPFPVRELSLSRALRGEESNDVEMFVRNSNVPNGASIRATGRPLRDEAGNLIGGVVVFRDVTERARVKKERDLLFNLSTDMLCVVGFDGYFRQLNPAWQRTLGWTVEELMSKPCTDFIHPEDLRSTVDTLTPKPGEGPFPSENAIAFENRYVCKDGSYRWISWNSHLSLDEQLIVGVARDVTEQRKAGETRAMLAAIVETSDASIIGETLDGKILAWNPGAERMYGYTPKEAIGESISMLIPPDCSNEESDTLGRIKTGERVPPYETARLTKGGKRIDIWLAASPLRDAGGRVIGTSRISRDITRLKETEQEVKRKSEELARSNAELERFAYIASHDLQEPLRMVTNYTQLLARRYAGKLDQEADEFIAYAVDGSNRMRGLINDILTYSRIGTRGKPFEPTSVQTVLDDAIGNLEHAIKESGAVITHSSLPTVLGDGSQLLQVFQNLIGNAIKFRREDPPRVHVSAEQTGTEWVFSVHDNGIGIDSRYFDRLFVMFQRLHSKSEYPGTGIGLALSKKIVERHGGRIWVESKLGEESTFRFTIPTEGRS
jgi:PAS domain S-box-containing protein